MINFSLEQVTQPVPFTLTPQTLMGEAIACMSQHGTSYGLVIDEYHHLRGIITERDVVRLIATDAEFQGRAIANVMTQDIITCQQSEEPDIFSLFQRMQQHRIRHLPVLGEQGELAGIISLTSLRQSLRPEHLLRFRRVSEVMTRSVMWALPSASLSHLAELMSHHGVSCVVIVAPSAIHSDTPPSSEGPEHRPIGIVTERDMLQFQFLGLAFSQVTAEEVMSTSVGTISGEENLWAAHETLQHMRVRRLVVTDEQGLLAGILTQSDVLRILDPMELCRIISALERSLAERSAELEQEKRQRQLIEQAQQVTEERLALTLELSGTGSWDLDIATGHAVWNDNHFRLMGLEPGEAEATYETWARHVHPDDLEQAIAAFNQTIETDCELTAEYRVVYPDAVNVIPGIHRTPERWVEIRGRVVRDRAGRATRLVGISLDITNRKRMEDALMRGEAHNRAVLNAVPDLLAIFGHDGTFQEVIRQSNSLENLMDSLPLDVNPVGQHVSQILPADVANRQLHAIQTAIATGNIQSYEQEIMIDDRIQYEDVRVSPIDDENVLVMVRDIGDRKRSEAEKSKAQAALQESEARFQEIAHAIDQKFFIRCVRTGKFLYASPAYETLYGRSRQSLYDDPDSWMEAIHPDDQQRIRQSVRDQFNQDAITREFRIIRADGAIQWIYTHTKIIRDADGQPIKLVGLASDVTEQKQYEASLRQYERIVHATTDGVALFDANYQYKIVNQTYLDWYQRSAEELIGQPVGDVLGNDFFQAVMKDHLDRCLQGEIIHMETWSRPFLCPRRYFDVRYTPYREVDGTITGIVVVLRDLTDLKRALDTRQVSNDILSSVGASVGYFRLFPDGRWETLYHSQGSDGVFGYAPDDFSAEVWLSNIVEEDVDAILNPALAALRHGQSCTIEYRFRRHNGSLCWISDTLTSWWDDDQQCWTVTAVGIDVSDRKRIEIEHCVIEDALRQENQFRSQIIEQMAEGLCVCCEVAGYPQVYFSVWNQRMTDITGYTQEEINEKGWHQSLYPDPIMQAQAAERMERMRRGDHLKREEWVITRADGEQRTVSISTVFLSSGSEMPLVLAVIEDVSQYKQIETALRQSRAELQLITDSIPAGIAYVDAHQRYQFVNKTYEQWFNRPSQDIVGITVRELLGDASYEVCRPSIEQVLRGTRSTQERCLQLGNGKTHHTLADLLPDIGADGAVRGYYALVNDISDRKQAEMAIENQRKLLRQVIDAIPSLIFARNRDGHFLMANEATAAIHGITPYDLIGNLEQQFNPLIDGDWTQKMLEQNRQVMDSGQPHFISEELLTTVEGDRRWYQTNILPYVDAHGNMLGIIGTSIDITERKQAEIALLEQRNFLQQVIDAIPNFVFVKNPDRQYVLANKAVAAIYGQPAEALVGKQDVDFSSNYAQSNQLQANNRRVMESLQSQTNADEYIVNYQGKGRWYQTTISPFLDMDGTVRGVIGTSVDISDRKQIEQNLQQSLREKDVLLSEVHHRVKNNLQVIVSLLNLQAMRMDDPDVQHVLEQSGDRVHAMALVHEKLYRTQHFEGISLSDYIREFVDHLAQGYTAADGSVDIHYRLDQSIDLPLAQAIQFSLILNELVTNALKHGSASQSGHQHLYVELARSEESHIVLRIGNTGHRLPHEFSLNAPRLSMGLQLIQVLAEQINGAIHVESSFPGSQNPGSQNPAIEERSPITWFTLSIPPASGSPNPDSCVKPAKS